MSERTLKQPVSSNARVPAPVRRDLEGAAGATGDASQSTTVVGRDQKTYPARHPTPVPSIVVRSSRDETRARAALAALGEEAPGRDPRHAPRKGTAGGSRSAPFR